MVWTLLGAAEEKKRENQMFLQSPLSGEKKCTHFSSPEKKEHLARREESVIALGEALENPPGPRKGG